MGVTRLSLTATHSSVEESVRQVKAAAMDYLRCNGETDLRHLLEELLASASRPYVSSALSDLLISGELELSAKRRVHLPQ